MSNRLGPGDRRDRGVHDLLARSLPEGKEGKMAAKTFDEYLKECGFDIPGKFSRRETARAGALWALRAAKEAMPTMALISAGDRSKGADNARGWNQCVSMVDERLSALLAETEGPSTPEAGT